MDTPIEESNLAHIGSDEDQAAKKAAAETEVCWKGAGEKPGIQIWRVENTRDEHDNPKFGINPWPKKRYGEFYRGDSYIVLKTSVDEEDGTKLQWDIYFWIGSESSQDEYGVAAYKANELDDLLDDAPVQHRELENYESEEFMNCFSNGIKYLNGGIDGGFRQVGVDSSEEVRVPIRLYHIRRIEKVTRSFQVPVTCASLNQGDTFVLDAGNVVYSWFGDECSAFEKSKAAQIAQHIASSRYGHSHTELDVQDDNEDFWTLLDGNQKDIKKADEYTDKMSTVAQQKTKLRILSDDGSFIQIKEVPAKRENLESDNVCLVDTGKSIFVWIGKSSSFREQQQAMSVVQTHLKNMGREKRTHVVRVKEGQEKRNKAFKKAFN